MRIERVPRSAFPVPTCRGVKGSGRLRICRTCPRGAPKISHWGASLYALPRPRHMSILRGPGRRGQFPAQTAPESLVSDIFREIDEELHRQRLRKPWDAYSNVIVVGT